MWGAFRNTLQAIGTNIKLGRHIESYVVSGVAAILALIGLIDDIVPMSVKLSAILGALALLVFNITRHESEGGIEDYLHQRKELGPLAARLAGTQKVWIYAPSAANILNPDNLSALQNNILNDPHGELRITIQNPDAAHTVAVLKHQLDNIVSFQDQDLLEEIQNTRTRFSRIERWEKKAKFEYRQLDFSPGCSIVIIDPHRATGVAIVELYGWRLNSVAERMSVEIAAAESPRWFEYWVNQYEALWRDAQSLSSKG